MVAAVVHNRWRQGGVFWLAILTTVVGGGLIALVTWLDAWHALFDWFADTSVLVTLVLLPLVVAAVAGAGSYRLLRRATP
jgi:hypothetical protein